MWSKIKGIQSVLAEFIQVSLAAPNIFKIVVVLFLAGIFDVAGFYLLIPVVEVLLFNNEDFGKFNVLQTVESILVIDLQFFHILIASIVFILLGLFLQAFGGFLSYRSRFYLVRDIRGNLIQAHSKMTMSSLITKHSGNLNDLLLNQSEQNGSGYFTVYSFWISFMQLVTFLILGVLISYQLLIVAGFIFMIAACFGGGLQWITRKHSESFTRGYQKFGVQVADYNNNVKTYKSSSYLSSILERIQSLATNVAIDLIRIYTLHVTQTFVLQLLTILAVFYLIYFYSSFGLLNSEVLVFLGVVRKVSGYVQNMFNNALSYQNYSGPMRLMRNEQEFALKNVETTGHETSEKNNIEFSKVVFSYDSKKTILEEVSFSIEDQKTTVIMGRSGSGKTTLLDLILMFYHPNQGKVKVGGVDTAKWDKVKFRDRVMYLNQEATLSLGTIRENITVGKDYDEQQVKDVCRQVKLSEWLSSLKHGLDTQVGEKGVSLSGGQVQRILLARALLDLPSVLILDEATSALDIETQKLVHDAIKSLHRKVMIIMISHDVTNLEYADNFLVVRDKTVACVDNIEKAKRLMAPS